MLCLLELQTTQCPVAPSPHMVRPHDEYMHAIPVCSSMKPIIHSPLTTLHTGCTHRQACSILQGQASTLRTRRSVLTVVCRRHQFFGYNEPHNKWLCAHTFPAHYACTGTPLCQWSLVGNILFWVEHMTSFCQVISVPQLTES